MSKDMKKGTTDTGFPFEVDGGILDDFELIELINETDKNALNMPDLARHLLGNEQYKKLKDHVREDGKVSALKMQMEITDILGKAAKN